MIDLFYKNIFSFKKYFLHFYFRVPFAYYLFAQAIIQVFIFTEENLFKLRSVLVRICNKELALSARYYYANNFLIVSMAKLILFTTCLWFNIQACISHGDVPLLLLVSFDGFRWDYLLKAKNSGKSTSNFDNLIQNGVFVEEGVKNVYITKTFPNHFSIVTGLYEENHGIVANNFFDPGKNEEIAINNHTTEIYWFNNGSDELHRVLLPLASSESGSMLALPW